MKERTYQQVLECMMKHTAEAHVNHVATDDAISLHEIYSCQLRNLAKLQERMV